MSSLIGQQPLSQDLRDLYQEYKRRQRMVVAWLAQSAGKDDDEPPQASHGHDYSTAELKQFSQAVKHKGTLMPANIAYCFKTMLQMRAEMSTHYRDDPEAGHESFRQILQEIYDQLSSPATSTLDPHERQTLAPQRSSDQPAASTYNPFMVLAGREENQGVSAGELPRLVADLRITQPTRPQQSRVTREPAPQSTAVTQASLLQNVNYMGTKNLSDVDAIVNLIKRVSRDWASKRTSTMMAAFLCETAVSVSVMLLEVVQTAGYDKLDVEKRLEWGQQHNEEWQNAFLNREYAEFVHARGFAVVEPCLHSFRSSRPASARQPEQKLVFLKPSDTIAPAIDKAKDRKYINAVLREIAQEEELNHSEGFKHAASISWSSRTVAPITNYLQAPSFNPHITLFALVTLLESARSSTWVNQTAEGGETQLTVNPVNPRLLALKFAQEALGALATFRSETAIFSILPDRCTLAVGQLSAALRQYVDRKGFNLMMQHPVRSGSDMAFIHHILFNIGIALCAWCKYISAVLHAYNALRTVKVIDPIPPLDGLCQALIEPAFYGSLPNTRFVEWWDTLGEARNCQGNAQEARHAEQLIPNPLLESAMKTFEKDQRGFPWLVWYGWQQNLRFLSTEFSLYHSLYLKPVGVRGATYELAARLTGNSKWKQFESLKPKQQQEIMENVVGDSGSFFVGLLELTESSLRKEFDDPSALIKWNFPAVYVSCVEVVSMGRNLTPREADEPNVGGIRDMLSLCDVLRKQLDRQERKRRRLELRGQQLTREEESGLQGVEISEESIVAVWRNAITKEFANKKVEDYQWNHLV